MPASALPRDLTDLIIDGLGAGPRLGEECLLALIACSTVHSSFVRPCHKYIFRGVTLLSPPSECTPDHYMYSQYQRTILFTETVTRQPHLCAYVKDVTYWVADGTRTLPAARGLVLQAVESLPCVTSLLLSGLDLRRRSRPHATIPHSIKIDDETAAVMLKIIQLGSLKSLSFRNLTGVSPAFLELGRSLETLYLSYSILSEDRAAAIPNNPLHQFPRIKTLTCDFASLEDFVCPYLLRRPSTSVFSCLEHIDIDFADELHSVGEENVHVSLLAQSKCVKSLDLKAHVILPPYPLHPPPPEPLLRCLNEQSYRTLSHLKYTITFDLGTPNLSIDNPYHALLDTPLSSFIQLQSIQINLVFQDHLEIDSVQSFGPQWGRLCDVLVASDAPPTLTEVRVLVHIRNVSSEPGQYSHVAGGEDCARAFLQNMCDLVYPVQFRALDSHPVDFSFEVSVSEGPFIELGAGNSLAEVI
ncbi:hypothetical protein NMY22_g15094 [Coprinellus aureogranulatus]|nr:hypothetical protein NMY22_g15094 [Coprinellus aureogranulatus]